MDLVSIGEFARLSRLSPKALRLYDQLGLLPPERVDPGSGYRWYAPGQLREARLVAALRQIEMPLREIKAILDLDPDAAAEQLAGYWAGVEAEHAARRALTGSLVGYLDGKRPVMYDVATRSVPARSLLCLQRHVNSGQLLAVGKDFIARIRDGSVPRLEGIPGALFVIYYGQVSGDSDGPVEWCRPVPDADAAAAAARFPDLTLRTESGHEEAFVHLPIAAQVGETEAMAVVQALEGWAAGQRRQPDGALRQVFIAPPPESAGLGPSCDFAVPLVPGQFR